MLHLFFSLPESDGFVLAGGAGLIAVGLSERPTEDIDLFAPEASVRAAGDALEIASSSKGWSVERVHDADTFRRLIIHLDGEEETMVDLAQHPPIPQQSSPRGRSSHCSTGRLSGISSTWIECLRCTPRSS